MDEFVDASGPEGFDRHPYGAVASFYDELAGFYSRGRIERSKQILQAGLEPGLRVLFAGVGRGSDALAAARRGLHVTGIDLAPRMLARVAKRFDAAGLEATWILGDAATHRPTVPYDAVVAHYFLNLWGTSQAEAMARHLAGCVRPGGELFVADFARPGAGLGARLRAYAYYAPVDAIAWSLGLGALHRILDYEAILPAAGWKIVEQVRLPVLNGGDPAFVAIRAERVG